VPSRFASGVAGPVSATPVPTSVTLASEDSAGVVGRPDRAEVHAINSADASQTHEPARRHTPGVVIVVSAPAPV
jgi:hypothetical protein